MEHAGMVHALEEIHRLLDPQGCLIDIHPLPESPLIQVHQQGRVFFTEPVPIYYNEDILAAEYAFEQVIQHQLFLVERAITIDFLTYASSVEELRAHYEQANAFDDSPQDETIAEWEAEIAPRVEQAMQTTGEGAEVVYHERARISRLRIPHS
jgi:hypothetical protein